MKTKWQQKEQIQKLIRQINWRITTLQTFLKKYESVLLVEMKSN